MVEIATEDFDIDKIIKRMHSPKIGAISIYLGTVREFPEGMGLEFEDDNRAVLKLKEIEKRAIDRFDIEDISIIHRIGFLAISENILLIAVSASHREPAFDACRIIIDEIKDFHKSWGKDISR